MTEAEKPLRRQVAMAYRAAKEAGKEEHDAFEAAMAAYNKERPGEERLAASARVAEMIASAVRVDPVCGSGRMCASLGRGRGTNAEDQAGRDHRRTGGRDVLASRTSAHAGMCNLSQSGGFRRNALLLVAAGP